jgi:hypothetical protein
MIRWTMLKAAAAIAVVAGAAAGFAVAAAPPAGEGTLYLERPVQMRPAATAPATRKWPVISPYLLQNGPMTISLSTWHDHPAKRPWTLSVNSAGQAELTIRTLPEARKKQFTVSAEDLAALRKALASENFFELQDQYGQIVLDGGHENITITVGDKTKSIRLDFLMNWVQPPADVEKLRDPARALRVVTLIRGWFDDPEAIDDRPYDKRVLDAVK